MKIGIETIRNATVATALLLTACGSDTESADDSTDSNPASVIDTQGAGSGATVEYLSDGSTITRIPPQAAHGKSVAVVQFCQGTNLLVNSQQGFSNSMVTGEGGGGSTNIVPNYEPCADGMLTPSDFVIDLVQE